jgi:RimJ/RimL family protein N-acetyltransferase
LKKEGASHRASGEIRLRAVTPDDIPAFYEHQLDPEANRMAAFPARERDAFFAHWEKILRENESLTRTIVLGDEVAGNVVCFEQKGRRLVGYWLGRKFWGRGVATRALSMFLREIPFRPLHAYVAKHNAGSIRVLEKCGFVVSGEGVVPAAEGREAVEEYLFTLAE